METLPQLRCVVIASEALCLCHTHPALIIPGSRQLQHPLAPGRLNINVEKLCTSSSQRIHNHAICKTIPGNTKGRNDTTSLGLSFISLSMCGTWHLIWTPTNTEEIFSLPLKALRRTRWNDSIQSAADVESSQAMQLLMASEWKSSLNRGD